MRKKGWWQQIQSDEYPTTQTNYGQDLQALDCDRGNIKSDKRDLEKKQNKIKNHARTNRLNKKRAYDKNKIDNINKQKIITIKCKACGHRKTYTEKELQLLSVRLSISDCKINKRIIGENIKRFICTKCNSKSCKIA